MSAVRMQIKASRRPAFKIPKFLSYSLNSGTSSVYRIYFPMNQTIQRMPWLKPVQLYYLDKAKSNISCIFNREGIIINNSFNF
jgi:hypothetical protein